jgi:hypothetical protein
LRARRRARRLDNDDLVSPDVATPDRGLEVTAHASDLRNRYWCAANRTPDGEAHCTRCVQLRAAQFQSATV